MIEDPIQIRTAEENDCEDIFTWRNDPLTVKSSLTGKVNYSEHKAWFQDRLKDKNTKMFIFSDSKSEKIGVVRFDKINNEARISINLNPLFRGKGLGKILLIRAIKSYFDNCGICRLVAEIKKDNLPSIKIFNNAGFKQNSNNGDILILYLDNGEINEIRN